MSILNFATLCQFHLGFYSFRAVLNKQLAIEYTPPHRIVVYGVISMTHPVSLKYIIRTLESRLIRSYDEMNHIGG